MRVNSFLARTYFTIVLSAFCILAFSEGAENFTKLPADNSSCYSITGIEVVGEISKTDEASDKSVVITPSVSSLYSFRSVYVDTESDVQFYYVTATGLTEDLVITAESPLQVSLSCKESFATTLSITPSSGSISNQKIYVRAFPVSIGSSTPKIIHSSGGTSVNVTTSVQSINSGIPSGYYSSATGTGETLKTQLYNIINNQNSVSYASLWTHFQTTDDAFSGKVWDMYSAKGCEEPDYEFTFVVDQDNGDAVNGEGELYNREHSMPASWFNDGTPMYSDMFHLYPADKHVNAQRGNYPFGTVESPVWTSTNGSKIGPNSLSGYSGTAFEPIDEYKGDFARSYFYMATRYENVISNWTYSSYGNEVLNETSYPVFETWFLNMLLQWHELDSVSQKERERNDAIYSIQGNRNPYIDNPSFVNSIWGDQQPPDPQEPATLETFDNLNAPTSSYVDGTFLGQDGSTWTFYQSRGDIQVTGKALMLGRNRTPQANVYSGSIEGGISTLTFDYVQAFSTNVNLNVLVNDVVVGNVTSTGEPGVIKNSGTINVYVDGNFVIKFINVNNSDGQVLIDNVDWTPYEVGVSTPSISPNGGTFYAPMSVSLSTLTDGASIYYSLDGNDPDINSNLYSAPFSVDQTVTVKAIAYKADIGYSSVAQSQFNFPAINDVSSISDLRVGLTDGKVYRLTGEAIVTFAQSYRNQKWIQDETSAIIIDDLNGQILGEYIIGTGITNIIGTLSLYSNMLQFTPVADADLISSPTTSVLPQEITMSQLVNNFSDFESQLVTIKDVDFTDADGSVVFANGVVQNISSNGTSGYFRSTFYDVDYIGGVVPQATKNITGILNERTVAPIGQFITARSLADFQDATSQTFSLTLNVSGEGTVTGAGEYQENQEISITATPAAGYCFISWKDGETVVSENSDFSYTMPAAEKVLTATFLKKGDVNGDGQQNVLDVVLITNYIIGLNPEGFFVQTANVDGDINDNVNVSDIVVLVNLIMGGAKK